jgi:transposase
LKFYIENRVKNFLKFVVNISLRGASSYNKRINLLSSIPAVGTLTAQYLIAYLPELGHLNNKALAALVGVAPYCRDSGKYCGKRFIQGGRQRLRNQLYMVAVSSVKHNSLLSAFYKKLREKGKPAKVALVAVIRKLLTMLNAVIMRHSAWEDRENIA